MTLLDSLLRTCDAEKYIDHFKKFQIDAYTLKVLQDQDLKIIGIEEESIRKSILEHAANLKIREEQFSSLDIDSEYIRLVLSQISTQLQKHAASLSLALTRKDVAICDIRLTPATECLYDCLSTLEMELDEFENRISGKVTRKSNAIKMILPAIAITIVLIFGCRRLLSN